MVLFTFALVLANIACLGQGSPKHSRRTSLHPSSHCLLANFHMESGLGAQR